MLYIQQKKNYQLEPWGRYTVEALHLSWPQSNLAHSLRQLETL